MPRSQMLLLLLLRIAQPVMPFLGARNLLSEPLAGQQGAGEEYIAGQEKMTTESSRGSLLKVRGIK